jgi:hypothetical protein
MCASGYAIRDNKNEAFLHSSTAGSHALWTYNLSSAKTFRTESEALFAITELFTGMAISSTRVLLKINVIDSPIRNFFRTIGTYLFHVLIGLIILCGIAVIVRIIGQFVWGW